jgi:hypothetical protein
MAQNRNVLTFFASEEVPRQTVSSAMIEGSSSRLREHKWSSSGWKNKRGATDLELHALPKAVEKTQ